jgi:hypothetical protein
MPELPAETLALWRGLPLCTPSATFRLLQDDVDDPPVYFDIATFNDVEGRIRQLVEDDGPFAAWTHYGGFFIEANGVTIAADEASDLVDEISMHQSWTRAAIALLNGSPRETVCAWEESAMTVDRVDEDTIVLLDQVPCGAMVLVVCPPVRFPLRAFSEALLAAVHPFVQLVTAVNRALDDLDPTRHFSPAVASCSRLENMNDEDLRRGLRIRELRGCLSLGWVEDANRLTQLLASTSRPWALP